MLAGPPWNRRGQHPPVDAGGIQAAVARLAGGRGAPAATTPHRLPSPLLHPNAPPLQPAGSKPPSPGLLADEGPQLPQGGYLGGVTRLLIPLPPHRPHPPGPLLQPPPMHRRLVWRAFCSSS